MHFFIGATAFLLTFLASALASPMELHARDRPVQPITCQPPNERVRVDWIVERYLDKVSGDPMRGIDVNFSNYIKLSHSGNYTYTVSAGVTAGAGGNVFVEVLRSEGKGLGQQFKISYFNGDGKKLASYVLFPNQRCTIKTPFDPLALNTVEVLSRTDD